MHMGGNQWYLADFGWSFGMHHLRWLTIILYFPFTSLIRRSQQRVDILYMFISTFHLFIPSSVVPENVMFSHLYCKLGLKARSRIAWFFPGMLELPNVILRSPLPQCLLWRLGEQLSGLLLSILRPQLFELVSTTHFALLRCLTQSPISRCKQHQDT